MMNHPLYKKLIEIDNGRFKKIVETFDIDGICFNCCQFNEKAKDGYKCACTPSCIGATLHPRVVSYILWKLDLITEDEHHKNLGMGKYEAIRNDLKVGDEVCISPLNKYHSEWGEQTSTIIDISLERDGIINYTITDGTPAGCDGWRRNDLIKV